LIRKTTDGAVILTVFNIKEALLVLVSFVIAKLIVYSFPVINPELIVKIEESVFFIKLEQLVGPNKQLHL
jgi:hypothetical protein